MATKPVTVLASAQWPKAAGFHGGLIPIIAGQLLDHMGIEPETKGADLEAVGSAADARAR